MRKDSELTTNLDDVYEKLFALKTNGGSEYVARAVHDATADMKWDQDQGTLKIIFVAGNEPANQDPQIPVERAVGEARQRGIFVNAIYCGGDGAYEAGGWRQVATLGSGSYAAIDQNRVVAIATPMDSELAKLSNELNRTYVGYGAVAREKSHQAGVDGLGGGLGRRTGGGLARRGQGVGALQQRRVGPGRRPRARQEGRGQDEGRRAARADAAHERRRSASSSSTARRSERGELQKRIADLSQKRDAFIQVERKKQATGPKGFDDAVTSSIRTEAESAGFAF